MTTNCDILDAGIAPPDDNGDETSEADYENSDADNEDNDDDDDVANKHAEGEEDVRADREKSGEMTDNEREENEDEGGEGGNGGEETGENIYRMIRHEENVTDDDRGILTLYATKSTKFIIFISQDR